MIRVTRQQARADGTVRTSDQLVDRASPLGAMFASPGTVQVAIVRSNGDEITYVRTN